MFMGLEDKEAMAIPDSNVNGSAIPAARITNMSLIWNFAATWFCAGSNWLALRIARTA